MKFWLQVFAKGKWMQEWTAEANTRAEGASASVSADLLETASKWRHSEFLNFYWKRNCVCNVMLKHNGTMQIERKTHTHPSKTKAM
jgi:hypothetical protein